MKKTSALIAENSLITAMMTRLELEKAGFNVDGIVNSREDFIQLVENHHPTLIIIDIHLEGLYNGIKIIKDLALPQKTDVIFLLTFYNQAIQNRMDKVHATDYIIKPFDDRDINQVLAKYRTDPSMSSEGESVPLSYIHNFD